MEGLVKCRRCYGKKVILFYSRGITGNKKLTKVKCPRCFGTGTILWIDEIMGRNKKGRKRQRKKPKGRI